MNSGYHSGMDDEFSLPEVIGTACSETLISVRHLILRALSSSQALERAGGYGGSNKLFSVERYARPAPYSVGRLSADDLAQRRAKRLDVFGLKRSELAQDQPLLDRGEYGFDQGRFRQPCALPITY